MISVTRSEKPCVEQDLPIQTMWLEGGVLPLPVGALNCTQCLAEGEGELGNQSGLLGAGEPDLVRPHWAISKADTLSVFKQLRQRGLRTKGGNMYIL